MKAVPEQAIVKTKEIGVSFSKLRFLNVPIQLIIDAYQKKYLKSLQFLLVLKLNFKSGKAKLSNLELILLEKIIGIKSRKTTKKHINFLLKKGFLRYNAKTGFYIIVGFDKIRRKHNWEMRLAFSITLKNQHKIKAITGAVIYAYLHKDFWRKVKGEKSLQIKGRSYHWISTKQNFKVQSAPVSVYGIKAIFDIPIASASRLKSLAAKNKLIRVKKNYSKTTFNNFERAFYSKTNEVQNFVHKQNKNRLQLIDTITPLFNFSKRKSLES